MGWLIASILLVVLLRTRHQLKALIEFARLQSNPEMSLNVGASSTPCLLQVCELSVLRFELDYLRAADAIPTARYAELAEHVDAVLATIVHQSWATPHS